MGGDSNPPFRIPVDQALGGGRLADLLLWRRCGGGIVVLASATAMWFLFEKAGYSLLSFASNVVLLLVTILFLWSKSASLLNRPLPPLPDMEISEASVVIIAHVLQEWINCVLCLAREITIGRNLKLFIQVACGLLAISFLGSLVNFLSLLYIGIVLALSIPFLYDKYQDHVNAMLPVAHEVTQTQLKRFEDIVLKKIPLYSNKEKKIQ